MHVEIKDTPARRLAAVRHHGPYNEIGKAFERLGAVAGSAGLFQPGAEMLALYHDDPRATPADQLRSDAGITVSESVVLPDGLTEQRLGPGRCACTVHVGPYEGLPDVWARLVGEWMPTSGKRRRQGASYEIYLNNPMNTPKDKLETEICIPID